VARQIQVYAERSLDRIRVHYEVEKELAARLRAAPREQRLHMLTGLYEELFRRVPDHPRLTLKRSPESSQLHVAQQIGLLQRFLRPHMTVMEIGPGDCALSFELTKHVRQVHAVDVDQVLPGNVRTPENFRLCLSDGVSVPVPAQSVDLAYSSQLMEHLHPEDARDQLRNIFAALAPGGTYVCITPNRLDGPHDVSRYFSAECEGFHLREYTMSELEALFRATGFRSIAFYSSIKGLWFRIPVRAMRLLEACLERTPARMRRKIAKTRPIPRLLNAALVAVR
jgi:SAM-dependent methyltransferase